MLIKQIAGATRVLGKNQGFLGLPILDRVVKCELTDGTTYDQNQMVSLWEPTPEELQDIIDGADVQVMILGTEHPALTLGVSTILDEPELQEQVAFTRLLAALDRYTTLIQNKNNLTRNPTSLDHMLDKMDYLIDLVERRFGN